MRRFEPLLSSKLFSHKPGQFQRNLEMIRFPVLGSYKFDGWRLFEYNGSPHTRTLKHPKNYHVVRKLSDFYSEVAAKTGLRGLDGEAVAGVITHKNAMQNSTSAFGSYAGAPEFTYMVFDSYQHASAPYQARLERVRFALRDFAESHPWVRIAEQRLLRSWDDVWAMETEALTLGYEGIMLRRPDAPYKMGRSSINDGGILTALKRFVDDEAVILEVHEMLHNSNPLEEDAFGRAKRSGHKEGLIPKGTFGHAVCRSEKFAERFRIGMGPGLDDAMRRWLWEHRREIVGEPVNYSYQETGCKDRPRHPKWRGLRGRENMPL